MGATWLARLAFADGVVVAQCPDRELEIESFTEACLEGVGVDRERGCVRLHQMTGPRTGQL